MRLFSIFIDSFRALDDQEVPADGLIVLFGPNSAGKTSVLEAVQDLLARTGAWRSDPGADEEPIVLGAVMYGLPDADVEGSVDAALYGSLLRGDHVGPEDSGDLQEPWPWAGPGLGERLRTADLQEAQVILSSALARTGDSGAAGDRDCLARALFDAKVAYFSTELDGTSIGAAVNDLPDDARDAAIHIAATRGTDDDALWTISRDLRDKGSAQLGWPASGAAQWDALSALFPRVVVLDGDIESLASELDRVIPVIHDRMWRFERHLEALDPDSPLRVYRVVGETFAAVGGRHRDPGFRVDPWLEIRSEDGRAAVFTLRTLGNYDADDWIRVRRTVLATARAVAAEANQIAPEFVRSQGTIGIEVLPASVWGAGQTRVRATFAEFGAEGRDLRVVGAGTARWAAAAIRLACLRLEQGSQIVTDDAGAIVEDADTRRQILITAQRDPLGQTPVRLEPSAAPGFYIADEPEAHLHPAAIQSVRNWLSRLSETATAVLVATHSPALLDSSARQVHRVLVTREDETAALTVLTSTLDQELADVSETLGISKGELLLMTRLALFVEGPHDQIMLDEWFGQDMRAAGIRVYPVHGADNLAGLAESEIIAALGIQIATLTDDTSIQRASSAAPRTTGEKAVARLVREAKRAGRQVHAFGLQQPDILYYLDETVCQKAAPAFPGWQAAFEAWRGTRRRPGSWKRCIEDQYNLDLSREGIGQLARECRRDGKIPAELASVISSVISLASARNGRHV